ncbi:hypothetical protein [Flavobacterium silvaticum]|uniref:Uncharacterized protein n=1 Tax=Flavobacterium silvaticum TaxID=1852020 RepID=A0A972FTE7_9FLAO|nr:hypothetical protein [Flavobacterium silvaticum]NMH28163.1 hypothetical protein [Flavobacterium silvaticum]
MKTLATKYFEVLERKLSLEEFRNWLQSQENSEEVKHDKLWKTFLSFNYASGSGNIGYEFSKLLRNFDLDEYAIFKFGNSLTQILEDGNLFRIVRSCRDFDSRYNYPLFGIIGDFDSQLDNEEFSYSEVRQKLASIAEPIELQWNALKSNTEKLALLRKQIEVAKATSTQGAVYDRFYGRMWKIWKN